MSIRPHYNITLPFEFTPVQVNGPLQDHFEIPIDVRHLVQKNHELRLWLQQLGLRIDGARYFQSCPYLVYKKHIDAERPPSGELLNRADVVKLNFVYNSTGSTMRWYKLLDGQTGEYYLNTYNEYTMGFPEDRVVEIYQANTDTHCLLDGGTIHDLANGENNNVNRICYSLILQFSKNTRSEKLTWDTAVKIFEPYIH